MRAKKPKSSRPPSYKKTSFGSGLYSPKTEDLRPSTSSPSPPAQSGYAKKTSSRPPPSSKNPQMQSLIKEFETELDDFHALTVPWERKLREMASGISALRLNSIIYKRFAPIYDDHMVDHARSISSLASQLFTMEKVGFEFPEKIVQSDLLEMSCGTGTVIRILADALPEQRLADLRITANDISADMQVRAMEKLHDLTVAYERYPIGQLPFAEESFGTIVLSQTLHFLTDDEVLRQERRSDYMFINEDRHVEAKFNAISQAFRMLKPGGTFIVFDEWPHILTNDGGPLGPKFAFLFNDNLRTIGRTALHRSVFSQIKGASFVAEMNVPIDSKHTMYMIVYAKNAGKTEDALPDFSRILGSRKDACERIMKMFRAIDQDFRDSVRSPGKRSFVKLLPMEKKVFVYNGTLPKHENYYNCAVVSGVFFHLDPSDKIRFLNSIIASVKRGGSVIFIEESISPVDSYHPFPLHTFKREFMARYSKYLAPSGVVRVPVLADSGMFGHQYRKII
ncbi:class I SAM-dependent methyltransferase [Candidatus Micrarchaeota archaeon]|nr:class I SAM-dependent methyltransferase [Candidatus Micrarchaeota archaeon]